MGVGDEVPQALEQLGARVELLDADDLAWGDLGRFDVIMTGVRAYERRADLRAHNQRLIDYARSRRHRHRQLQQVRVQRRAVRAVSRQGRSRARDRRERRSARRSQPQHPVFTTPNRIGRADWKGWVQERGLYFFDTAGRDPQSSTCSSSTIRSRTTRARSAARSSKPRSARAAGSTSVLGSGVSCRPAPTARSG